MTEMKSSSISSSSSEALLPITYLFPPNQIITKQYQPDITPVFKLIKTHQISKAIAIPQSMTYGSKFEQVDTLGYEYLQMMKNNVVYMKFNNENYMKMNLKGCNYKFMSGLFISLQLLTQEKLKLYKNVYKCLPNLQFVEYSNNILHSFANNSIAEYPDLRFSSNYQSSNLFLAIKRKQFQYDLILQNDINSKGNTQWFNFAVNIREPGTYRFNIVNFTKSTSLHQKGMKIACYSYQNMEYNKMGWFKGGRDILYQQTNVSRQDCSQQSYYKLQFDYCSNYKNDTVIFAYSYPYSSIDLEKFFNKILYKRNGSNMKIDRVKICQTLSGFPIYAYMITSKKTNKIANRSKSSQKFYKYNQTFNSPNVQSKSAKKSIIFMGRQHPGETPSSYVMEGIVDHIMDNNDHQTIKKNFNFIIIPIVNVDGVFYGNYRTNLSGNDLNRMWRNPRKDYHCEIYSIKKLMVDINRQSPISLIIDVHGHSRSLNSFFYGNPSRKDFLQSVQNPRYFPYLCSKRTKQISFLQSTFTISEDKKNTARVVLSQMFPKALVYTFQTSFYGWKKGSEIIQFTPDSYRKIGKDLLLGYLEYIRLTQKNLQILDKWQKEIQQLNASSIHDIQNINQKAQSDSQAENQLIQFPQASPSVVNIDANTANQRSFDDRKYVRQTNIKKRSVRVIKSSRKCLIPMPLSPKLCPPQSFQPQQKSQNTSQNTSKKLSPTYKDNAFLSIVRIDTKTEGSNKIVNNQNQQSDKNLNLYNQREILIQKLRRRKINLQEAMKSCSGVKGFLRAMGITIERR